MSMIGVLFFVAAMLIGLAVIVGMIARNAPAVLSALRMDERPPVDPRILAELIAKSRG